MRFLIMKSANYTRKHHMYLMNHKNGDVIEVRMDKKNKTFKKIRLYRQDGLGNYYLDPHAEFKDQKSPATKENIVEAGKKVSDHISSAENWHHKVRPIFNAEHKIVDFEPRLHLEHHTKIQNAKRYLRHLERRHTDFIFRKNSKTPLLIPWNYIKDMIYEDRNKEMVLAHKVHKLRK